LAEGKPAHHRVVQPQPLRQQRQRADELTSRLATGLRTRLDSSRKRLNSARLSVASFDFRAKIGVLGLRMQKLTQELFVREERLMRQKREGWERLSLQLQERSPLKVLERGYAIATDAAGKIITDAAEVQIGHNLTLQLRRGRVISEVKKKE